MELKEITNDEFKAFSKMFNPSSMYQTVEYALTMNEEDCDSFFVGLFEENSLKAASLILVQKISGFKYAFAPRGFLLDFNISGLHTKPFISKSSFSAFTSNILLDICIPYIS